MKEVSKALKNAVSEVFGSAPGSAVTGGRKAGASSSRSRSMAMPKDYVANFVADVSSDTRMTSVHASVPFDCADIGGQLGEDLRQRFGQFRKMVVMRLPPSLAEVDGAHGTVGGGIVTIGPAQYGLVLLLQSGEAQGAIIMPFGVPGVFDYIEQCLRSDEMPLMGWCADERTEGLMTMPPFLREHADLIRNLYRSQRSSDELAEHIGSFAKFLCEDGAETIVPGVEVKRLMVTCVVPAS